MSWPDACQENPDDCPVAATPASPLDFPSENLLNASQTDLLHSMRSVPPGYPLQGLLIYIESHMGRFFSGAEARLWFSGLRCF